MTAIANLVWETTTTTGTGDKTLTQVAQRFSTAFGTGSDTDVFYYFMFNADVAGEYEWGTGHMSDANTLVADTVLGGSNGTSPVNFSAGTKHVTNSLPASLLEKLISTREVLTAARTYYVDGTLGDDANDGLSSGAGAFATIQKALDVAATIDFGGNPVTIQLADGTYTEGGVVPVTVGQASTTDLLIKGNSSNAQSVVVLVTGGHCFTTAAGGRARIDDLSVGTVTSGHCIYARGVGSELRWSNLRFGNCAGDHIVSASGANVFCDGNYSITGGASRHVNLGSGGIGTIANKTITLTGTPDFQIFSQVQQAHLQSFSNTYVGSATGKRYNAILNGTIQTFGGGANALPGSVAGTVATGGVYV